MIHRDFNVLIHGFGFLVATSCSTVYRPPTTCSSDDDCRPGEVCLVDLGGTCHDASEVPDDLGFSICDQQDNSSADCGFRTELRVDDHLIEKIPPSPGSFRVFRPVVSDYVKLTFEDLSPSLASRSASFELWQPSRLGLRPLRVEGEIDAEQETTVPVAFPFFDLRDETDDLALSRRSIIAMLVSPSLRLGPEHYYLMRSATNREACLEDEDCRGGRYCVADLGECSPLATTPDHPDTYHLQANSEYHYILGGTTEEVTTTGQVRRLSGVEMTLRYPSVPEDLAIPVFGTMEDLPCEDDSQCFPDVARCDQASGTCVLRLGGRPASAPFSSGELGTFSDERVNLYGGRVPPREQTFSLTAQDRDRERPAMNFILENSIDDEDIDNKEITAVVCLPEWAPAAEIEVQVRGNPETLLSSGGAQWTCCDTSCLPTDETGLPVDDMGPCVGASSSQGPTIRLNSDLLQSQIDSITSSPAWVTQGCLTPSAVEGVVGQVSRVSTSCSTRTEPCLVSVSPGIPGETRSYTVRVEPRSGSVLQSVALQVAFPRKEPIIVDLPARPRLVGRVTLPESQCDEDDGESCGASRATVLAERLRLEDDENELGPFFYSTTTFYDPTTGDSGAYVLPVNPGVYVVTALPDNRSGAGPADIVIVDLRHDEDESLEHELTLPLRQGVPVLLNLIDFNAASVTPLDLGSWKSLCHPDASNDPCADDCDRTLDLNAINQCHGNVAEGCRIRTLLREGVALYPNVADEIQFLARGRRDMCDE